MSLALIVSHLIDLGFSSTDATNAVHAVGPELDHCVTWIIEHGNNEIIQENHSRSPSRLSRFYVDRPVYDQQSVSEKIVPNRESPNNCLDANVSVSVDAVEWKEETLLKQEVLMENVCMDEVDSLVAMGFERNLAMVALNLYPNNLESAVNWIVGGGAEKLEREKTRVNEKKGDAVLFTPIDMISYKSQSLHVDEQSLNPDALSQAVWFRDLMTIKDYAARSKSILNGFDSRGFTPLSLAIMLEHGDVVNFLLSSGADPRAKNSNGWTALQIASILKQTNVLMDLYLNQVILDFSDWNARLPILEAKLINLPNFYLEIKLEIKSWVPFVNSFAPSDTFKIWKHGSRLRFDSNLRGIMGGNVQKGRISFLFDCEVRGKPNVYLVDHTREQYEDVLLQFRNPPFEMIRRDVEFMMQAETVNSEFQTCNAVFKTRESLFGGVASENIGEWPSTIVDTQGLKFQIKKNAEPPQKPEFEEYFSSKTILSFTDSFLVNKDVSATLWLSEHFPLLRNNINDVLGMYYPCIFLK